MLWTQGQTECVTTRTLLISYARWNIWQGSDQLQMQGGADKPYSHRPPHGYHEPMAQPMQQSALDLQQHKRPTISASSTKGQKFDQQCLTPSLQLVQSMVSTISGNLLARKKQLQLITTHSQTQEPTQGVPIVSEELLWLTRIHKPSEELCYVPTQKIC